MTGGRAVVGGDVLPGQGLERGPQAGLVTFHRQHVVMTLPGKGAGSGALGVQRISGDNDLVAWQGFPAEPVGRRSRRSSRGAGVVSGHDPAAGDSGQQMRRCHVTSFRSTQGFAVDRHHHVTLPSGGVTGQQPRPDHRGQFVGVEGLEDSADRGFRRYSTSRAQQPRPGQEITAHSAIAARLLAPAHTAAVAMARTPARSWRRPRRPRGSAMVANTPNSDWPQTGMVRDDEHTRGTS